MDPSGADFDAAPADEPGEGDVRDEAPASPEALDAELLTGGGTLLPWAIFLARIQLGLMFFMPGLWRVFEIGPMEHARRFFVEPYAATGIPEWLLWAAGVSVPFIEQTAGALLLIGLFRKGALIVLGLELCLITYGHLVLEPLFAFHTHVLPRLILLLFLMVVPLERDRWALDSLVRARGRRSR